MTDAANQNVPESKIKLLLTKILQWIKAVLVWIKSVLLWVLAKLDAIFKKPANPV